MTESLYKQFIHQQKVVCWSELSHSVISVIYNTVVISFINSRKRTGPRTEPWGTPDMMFAGDEWETLLRQVEFD